jgi:site-specific DNA-methyltransferase (adenine-specific)
MQGMKEFPDKYFELAIVDPPYGIDVASKSKMSTSSTKEYVIKNWDEFVPDASYFHELSRISKNRIIWGANFFDGFGLSGGGIVWNKLGNHIGRRNPLPDLSDCEYAYCSMRNNIKMFSYTQIGNVYGNDYQIDWEQDRIHPTQKPVALYKWLLKNYAKEGDKILDTHLGSQSSRIAAFDMGFDFTGYELDKDYFEAGNKRFNQHKAQLKLFS